MDAAFTIRDMEPADREVVIDLMTALNRFEDRISGDRVTDRRGGLACLLDDVEKLREHGGIQLVAEAGGAVIAYLSCAITHGAPFLKPEVRMYAYVHSLVVAETARGQGIGEALMRAAEDFARSQGMRSLAVGQLAGNEGAGRLYERLGLRAHAIERVKWLD